MNPSIPSIVAPSSPQKSASGKAPFGQLVHEQRLRGIAVPVGPGDYSGIFVQADRIMRFSRLTIQTLFVLGLPLIVAAFELSVWTALALVTAALLWRWALTLSALLAAPRGPPIMLESISLSHFVEKVRWCLDRLGLPYAEVQNVGTLGVFCIGRTVPRLHVRTGAVTSRIGDSPAILRYLWGAYASEFGERADFLEPTAEALELEARLDRYGVWLQQWIYHHILPHRRVSLHAWGADDPSLPAWQRLSIIVLFPVIRVLMRRALRVRPESHERTVARIEDILGELDQRLADGRRTLLGGEQIAFVDITLAALSGLWINAPEYGGGKADSVRPAEADYPAAMAAEIAAWRQKFPRVTDFVERLYREERFPIG